jgi:hypothetical protein
MSKCQNPGRLKATRAVACLLAGLAACCGASATASASPASALPDGRGYELVSPPLKNGGEIMPNSQRSRAAGDGSAVGFASLSGFGDVASVGVSTDYVAVRTGTSGTSGWATHAITPAQDPLPFVADTHFMEPLYWGEFSDDLSRGILRSFSPVTNAPNVANEQNWYVRDNLRQAGAGSYQLLTDCPACGSPIPPVANAFAIGEQSILAGTSQDFGHVIFESFLPLTANSTADPSGPNYNLYEWDHGTVRLAGVLPDTACGSPPCAAVQSQAGIGASFGDYTPDSISSDGSHIFFTVPENNCNGLGHNDCGELYARIDHATTVQLNVSEKTNGAGPGGTDENGTQSATYWDASTDGSRVYFTSTEALTNDALVGGDRKLYMYSDTADGQGHHLTLLSADHAPADDSSTTNDVRGVIGTSTDGHTVYFITSGGQIVAGGPTAPILGTDDKIYRWHDGTVDYVGAISSEDETRDLNADYGANPKQSRVSPDGDSLLFTAETGVGLTGYDHGTTCTNNGTSSGSCRELYLYRADAQPHLVCASCNPSGAPATADAQDIVQTAFGAATTTSHLNHALSDEGQRVFFSSGEALVSQDTNNKVDAYEYDAVDGTVHLLSGGKDPSDSYFMDASRNGDDAFIITRQKLVGWDVDGSYDLYDVRVGGGVPDPVAKIVCSADTCRGPVSAAPTATQVGSTVVAGSNVTTTRVKKRAAKKPKTGKCRRGFVHKKVHKHVRCVKVKARKPARHGRAR